MLTGAILDLQIEVVSRAFLSLLLTLLLLLRPLLLLEALELATLIDFTALAMYKLLLVLPSKAAEQRS